ncbi:hypothetical protein AB6A40_005820 [Gnathostoma spinigerum]|uniref:Uncharacterized protein n=1 Tax=Gnathostoma spinigerum TaxID=75299 RepID=A0ABD6EIM9_9BILA
MPHFFPIIHLSHPNSSISLPPTTITLDSTVLTKRTDLSFLSSLFVLFINDNARRVLDSFVFSNTPITSNVLRSSANITAFGRKDYCLQFTERLTELNDAI